MEAGRAAAQRGGPRRPVRRLANHGRTRGEGPAACGARRAARGLGDLRQDRRARGGRTLLRAPHSRARRDRDLRADLPGHDGIAAGPNARARPGKPRRRRRPGRAGVGPVPPVHRPEGVGRLLRAPRVRAAEGRDEPADHRCPRRGAHPGGPPRSDRRPLSRAGPLRSRGAGQPGGGLRRDRAFPAAGSAAHRLCRRAERRRDGRGARRRVPRSALRLGRAVRARVRPPSRPGGCWERARAHGLPRAPTPSSAPTTGRRPGSCTR